MKLGGLRAPVVCSFSLSYLPLQENDMSDTEIYTGTNPDLVEEAMVVYAD